MEAGSWGMRCDSACRAYVGEGEQGEDADSEAPKVGAISVHIPTDPRANGALMLGAYFEPGPFHF